MKEFTTAVKESIGETEESMTFSIDGVECTCFPPKDGQLAFLMASTTGHSSTQEQIAGIVNFFVAVLDDDSHSYIVGRLLDRHDEFGLVQVQSIMEWMVEEWTGRPTQPPSVSTRSRSNGGRKSTPRTTKSTSPALVQQES
jgi:hypothetical protein